MDSLELLHGLQAHDDEAFRTIARTYGKSVYERLLARSGNPALAKQALKAALTDLYAAVSAADNRDPVEALLFTFAERAQSAMQQNAGNERMEAPVRSAADAGDNTSAMREAKATARGLETDNRRAPVGADMPPAQQALPPDSEPKKHGFGRTAAVILLCVGILLMLWVIAGLLMDMELLPPVDLGYEWFNRQIAPWF